MSNNRSDIKAITARCIKCNEFLFYDGKKEIFSYYTPHECGGNIEVMVGTIKLHGAHPFYPEKTFEGPYFYAYRNKHGECFVYHNEKLHMIENPIVVEKTKEHA